MTIEFSQPTSHLIGCLAHVDFRYFVAPPLSAKQKRKAAAAAGQIPLKTKCARHHRVFTACLKSMLLVPKPPQSAWKPRQNMQGSTRGFWHVMQPGLWSGRRRELKRGVWLAPRSLWMPFGAHSMLRKKVRGWSSSISFAPFAYHMINHIHLIRRSRHYSSDRI